MFTFTQNSGLVRIWGRRVIAGTCTLEDVPKLSNLHEAVKEYVNANTDKESETE